MSNLWEAIRHTRSVEDPDGVTTDDETSASATEEVPTEEVPTKEDPEVWKYVRLKVSFLGAGKYANELIWEFGDEERADDLRVSEGELEKYLAAARALAKEITGEGVGFWVDGSGDTYIARDKIVYTVINTLTRRRR